MKYGPSLISETIQRVMEERGLDREKMADTVSEGVSPSVISQWVKGSSLPEEKKLVTIAEIGGKDKESLILEKLMLRLKLLGIQLDKKAAIAYIETCRFAN